MNLMEMVLKDVYKLIYDECDVWYVDGAVTITKLQLNGDCSVRVIEEGAYLFYTDCPSGGIPTESVYTTYKAAKAAALRRLEVMADVIRDDTAGEEVD